MVARGPLDRDVVDLAASDCLILTYASLEFTPFEKRLGVACDIDKTLTNRTFAGY